MDNIGVGPSLGNRLADGMGLGRPAAESQGKAYLAHSEAQLLLRQVFLPF
jgi:hypothetical protein